MTCCVAINAKEGYCWIVLSLMSHKCHTSHQSYQSLVISVISLSSPSSDSDNRVHSVIEENEAVSVNRAHSVNKGNMKNSFYQDHSVIKGIMEKSVLTELHSVLEGQFSSSSLGHLRKLSSYRVLLAIEEVVTEFVVLTELSRLTQKLFSEQY